VVIRDVLFLYNIRVFTEFLYLLLFTAEILQCLLPVLPFFIHCRPIIIIIIILFQSFMLARANYVQFRINAAKTFSKIFLVTHRFLDGDLTVYQSITLIACITDTLGNICSPCRALGGTHYVPVLKPKH